MITVLVVDDMPVLAEQYAYDLTRTAGYEVLVATGGREALELLEREAVDCMILDLEMPGMDGFEVLRAVDRRGEGRRVPVIVYTGTGNYDRCIQAMRLGAHGFIDKAEPMERVVREIEHVLERRRLTAEVSALRDGTALIGGSAGMGRLREQIARVAPIPSPVLIAGESGTGKELVAREIHRRSASGRGERPFIAINSAALPAELVESELFGHERGAFTGAVAARKGAFEAAAGGTLLLDEVGELPLAAQAKLLRVLEQRQVTRLGGTRTIDVDTRVLAATNRDLDQEVTAGRFREDLLYRLNVHVVVVPPLRERQSDIPELVAHLGEQICARFGIGRRSFAPAALECLMAYDWRRNNVRELRNVVERMIIATDRDVLTGDDVPADIRGSNAAPPTGGNHRTFHERKAEAERQIVVAALERNHWQVTRTAQDLGLADHASLLKIMRRHGISRG